MAFTEDEAAYLKSQPLARISTVGLDGQPDVTPVSFEFDGTYFYVGGWAPERTRRFRNVKAGNAKVALVVDDLVSVDPWTPRFLRVYGTAELVGRQGQFGPARYMRITPEISWSWNPDGRSSTDESRTSGPRRTVHRGGQ
jgi:pyridoxamine 5'-phosphate oxidase family protein